MLPKETKDFDIKISVIMPVYNERGTIREILKQVRKVNIGKEIIIVDDCSTDGTQDLLRYLDKDIKIIYHAHNKGKGEAIKTGLRKAGGDLVIIQDADLEYNPQDYYKLIEPIVKGETDIVYGSRFLRDNKFAVSCHHLGNRFLTLATNLLYGSKLTDMETCYKVFRREILESMEIEAVSFDFEPEVTAKALKKGYKILEVPISYRGRSYHEGKKISWKDGLTALSCLLKFKFRRFAKPNSKKKANA